MTQSKSFEELLVEESIRGFNAGYSSRDDEIASLNKRIIEVEADSVRANFKWALQKVDLQNQNDSLSKKLEIAMEALEKYKSIAWRETMEGPIWAAKDALEQIKEVEG